MVSAWPEPPSVMSAEKSAGVGDGMEAFALGGTKTPPNRLGKEKSGVQNTLNFPCKTAQIRDSKWLLRQRGQKIDVFVLGSF